MASDEHHLMEETARLAQHPVSRATFLKLATAAGATSLLGAMGCGGDSSPSTTGAGAAAGGKSIQRGVLTNQVTTLSNNYFVEWTDGVKQLARGLGVELHTVTHEGNVSTQLAQVGDVKNSGGKMLFGAVATQGVLPAVARACQNAQIYYSNLFDLPAWFTPPDVGDYYVAFYVQQSELVAHDMATRLFEEMGGRGTFIHVPGIPGASADDQRTAGVLRAMERFPEIERFASAPGNWNQTDGRRAFADAIQARPDYTGVFAQNDAMIVGIQSVLAERGVSGKPIVGIDGDKQNIGYIRDGRQLATAATISGWDAALAAVAVFDALNGWKPQMCERMMFIPSVYVDGRNADDYFEAFMAKPELPFEWEQMSRALHPSDWNIQADVTPIDPREFWKGIPQKDFQLNADYAKALDAGELDRVRALYAQHYVDGPFKAFGA